MLNSSHRSLLRALALSLLGHAVLFSSAFPLSPPSPGLAAGALHALIVAPAPQSARPAGAPQSSAPRPAAAAPPPAAASRPAASAAEPPADAKPVMAVARPAATTAASAASVPTPVKAAPGDSAALLPGPAAAAANLAATGSGAAPAGGTAPGTAPAAGRAGVSADDLRQYRLSLASAARRFKRYPALARQYGWEGTVEVALDFSALAPLPQVLLLHSSGRQALDAQALDMLSQAAGVTVLPVGLRERDFRVVLPVQFSLENDP